MYVGALITILLAAFCRQYGIERYLWTFESGLLPYTRSLSHFQQPRAAAVIVVLTRNSDIQGITSSLIQLEDRFNKNYLYPYVFLNDVPFDESFKTQVKSLTNASVQFGVVPEDQWNPPPWINESRATASRLDMAQNGVLYGGSLSYRNMCRFYSGFFYRHELLQPFKYYWRVEPDVKFSCDLDYDPFLFMENHEKVYGFTITLYEFLNTVPSLWEAVKEFIHLHPHLVSPENALAFISDDNGESYNLCHFWSNFEIGDFDFWRGEAYSTFFDFLDKKGGFYYERWGDAPIHSIAVSLFARRDQIHFFNDIGYQHPPFQHCPQGDAYKKGNCWCDMPRNFDYAPWSCLKKFDTLFACDTHATGIGCGREAIPDRT